MTTETWRQVKQVCDVLAIMFLIASIASTVDIDTFKEHLKRPKGVTSIYFIFTMH